MAQKVPPDRTTERRSARRGGMSIAIGPRMATAMALLCSHCGVPRYFKSSGDCSGAVGAVVEGSGVAILGTSLVRGWPGSVQAILGPSLNATKLDRNALGCYLRTTLVKKSPRSFNCCKKSYLIGAHGSDPTRADQRQR